MQKKIGKLKDDDWANIHNQLLDSWNKLTQLLSISKFTILTMKTQKNVILC